jgi:hypothetical protein
MVDPSVYRRVGDSGLTPHEEHGIEDFEPPAAVEDHGKLSHTDPPRRSIHLGRCRPEACLRPPACLRY